MKEFGSDFHYIESWKNAVETIEFYCPNAIFYATGRQAIIDLYVKMGWKRLWVPQYFCYDVVNAMLLSDVNIEYYLDFPTFEEGKILQSLPFESGDALLRVNYFGLRSKRSNLGLSVPVIEDHTHDLIGGWARNSDADWCIASLRKSLPLAEGGVLWSPKGKILQQEPKTTLINEEIASKRWNAMRLKSLYLDNKLEDKEDYRNTMISTEKQLDSMAEVSSVDYETREYLKHFNLSFWYSRKQENRKSIINYFKAEGFNIIEPEGIDCNPFSLITLFNNEEERDRCRCKLISKGIYPAILWKLPSNKYYKLVDFSKRMLSIHCDARYSIDDMRDMFNLITKAK